MKSKINTLLVRFKKSKDGKVIASNFGYLMLLQIAGYIFPLITIPYLASTIGVEGFGKIAFAAAVIVWFQTVTDWGFSYTATRDIAQNKDNHEMVSEILSNVFWARVFLSVVSLILLILLISFIPYFRENKNILLLTFLLVPAHICFPEWFFQAIERMKYISIFSLVSKFLFTLSVFLFIKEREDYFLHPLLNSLSFFVVGMFSIYLILFKWGYKINRPKAENIKMVICRGFDAFLNSILPNLYNSLAIVILGFFHGVAAVGIYDAGKKLINLMHSFMQVGIKVTFPFLARRIDKHSFFAKYYIACSLVLTLFSFFLSPKIIDILFDKEFLGAVLVLKISSVSIFLVALSKVFGLNYLLLKGFDKELRRITLLSSIFGFFISWPLVYFYGYLGAALTLVITQALLGLKVTIKAYEVKRRYV